MHFTPSRIWTVLGFAASISFCEAQDNSSTTNTTDLTRCPLVIENFSPNVSVNSTGTQSFKWTSETDDWFLTMTLNDTRNPLLRSQMHYLQGYLSMPEETTGGLCAYMLPGLDTDADAGKGQVGCDNILSEECIRYLEASGGPISQNSVQGKIGCPSPPPVAEMRQRCANERWHENMVWTSTSTYFYHLSSRTLP